MQELVSLGLTGRDLLMAWVSRRVIPLQRRPHKLCFLSDLRDPSRTTRRVMLEDEAAQLARPSSMAGWRTTGSSTWLPITAASLHHR